MFDEIDYLLEGQNAERFASLYGLYPRKSSVIVSIFTQCVSISKVYL